MKARPGFRPHGRVDAEPTNGHKPDSVVPPVTPVRSRAVVPAELAKPFPVDDPGDTSYEGQAARAFTADFRRRDASGRPTEPPISPATAVARLALRVGRRAVGEGRLPTPREAALVLEEAMEHAAVPALDKVGEVLEEHVGPVVPKSTLGRLAGGLGAARDAARTVRDHAETHGHQYVSWSEAATLLGAHSAVDQVVEQVGPRPLSSADLGEKGTLRGVAGIAGWALENWVRSKAAKAADTKGRDAVVGHATGRTGKKKGR